MKYFFTILLTLLCLVNISFAKVFTDDLNRSINIPASPKKVWVAYPPLTFFVSTLAPDLLAGWNFPLSFESEYYLDNPVKNLPVIGGWFGQREPNLEALLSTKPDLALVWDTSYAKNLKLKTTMDKHKIPVVALQVWDVTSYSTLFRKLGIILNRSEEAEVFASYIENSLLRLDRYNKQNKKDKKPLVFYALGKDGLKIDCAHHHFIAQSMHLAQAELLDFCSKEDVSLSINLEHLYLNQPDAIFVQDKMLWERIISDSRWNKLDAVKKKKIFLVPSEPYNWIIYPPSFMRVLASHWIKASLYPEYKNSFVQEMEIFFNLFFHKPPSQRLLDELNV